MTLSDAAACHTRIFPLQVNQCRLDPAVCGSLLALPLTKTTVGVWDLTDCRADAVSLVGHRRSISALAFSHDEPTLLCSAAEDYAIVWNVRKCLHNAAQGLEVRGEVILPRPGDVIHVSFSTDATRVALCTDMVVKVVSVSQCKVVAELSGHAARVTAAEFCPHYTATVVSVSDDRTVIVWDVHRLCLLHQTSVLCSAPLISLAMNAAQPQVAVASASGVIKVFDLADDKNFRQLCQMDAGKMLSKFRQSQPQRQSPAPGDGPVVVTKGGASRRVEGSVPQGGDAGSSSIECSDAVLSLLYVYPEGCWQPGKGRGGVGGHGAVREVLTAVSPVLVVVSAHGALQVDSRTLEALCVLDFQQPLPSTFQPTIPHLTINGLGLAAVGQVTDTHLVLVLGTLFESRVHSVQWEMVAGKVSEASNGHAVPEDSTVLASSSAEVVDGCVGELGMVATKPLTDNSPLKAEFPPEAPSGTSTPGKNPAWRRGSSQHAAKKPDPMNQPLTFKKKVKSSGYTQAPRTTMFQPKTNAPPKAADTSRRQSGQGQSLAARLSSQEYPQDAGPPTDLDCRLATGSAPSSITDLRFSSTGQHLSLCMSNKTALVFPAPFGQKDSSVFVGHNSTINSIRWSNSGKHFLTASNDKTAILWDRASGESLLVFNSLRNNIRDSQGGEKGKARDGYPKEVRGAQFYYMDKFVMIIMGNQLCLYKYHLDPTKDDIRRYLTKSRYKLVKSWETPSHNFTAFSAVNTFYSHLAVCAGSNRNVEVYDLNEGRLAHVFTDTHTKPVHTVALNEGSTYTSQPQEAFNVFATSATLDCIKVWDVRSRRCVLRLQGHANQAHGCGIAFSACGTYLGSGSEDKVAYVYDIRQGTFCQKLRGHTDVVSSVTFHPACPLIATGATDGKVLLFKA
ncbi:WD repeat-containing protein 27-like [Babylonia areolata]|uniref:WD repeat-containing protein 27-like n=1 Tax=Babylonia areolata TaxID=304850 RepID=UPI003FD00DA2